MSASSICFPVARYCVTDAFSLPPCFPLFMGVIVYILEYFSFIWLLCSALVFNVLVAICVRKGKIKEVCFEIQVSISKFAL